MIVVSFSRHHLDLCIHISTHLFMYACGMTLLLTSSGRLLFHHNGFENHLSPCVSLSLYVSIRATGKYICVTGRTQWRLMTRTPSEAARSRLCSSRLFRERNTMRSVCTMVMSFSHSSVADLFWTTYAFRRFRHSSATGMLIVRTDPSSLDLLDENNRRCPPG
jgi:hypothetical protein